MKSGLNALEFCGTRSCIERAYLDVGLYSAMCLKEGLKVTFDLSGDTRPRSIKYIQLHLDLVGFCLYDSVAFDLF